MVTIGRRNIRSRLTPGNQGMSKRVDDKLNSIVDAHASKFKTALAVDGAVSFIWNKHRGVIACTCRGLRNLDNIASHEIGLTGHETPVTDVTLDKGTRTASPVATLANGGVRQVGGLNESSIDQLFKHQSETVVEKIAGDNDEEFTEDSEVDIFDAMFNEGDAGPMFAGDGDPMQNLIASDNFGNSSDHGFTSQMVACSICFGSGFVDTWRLYNGERIVLDASAAHGIDVFGAVDVDNTSQPIVYALYERSYIRWSQVDIPTSWRHLIRIHVYNKNELISPERYTLFWRHAAAPGVRNVLTYDTLNALNGSPLLMGDNKLIIELEPNIDDPEESLIFTHAEILLSLGHPVRIQVPEMEIPNEDEYIDWNASPTFESPSDIEVKENSYVIEGKYRRIWKVTSINRKLSARGISFGYSLSTRSLHSFERQYFLMNVFRRPRNPFHNNQLRGMDDDPDV